MSFFFTLQLFCVCIQAFWLSKSSSKVMDLLLSTLKDRVTPGEACAIHKHLCYFMFILYLLYRNSDCASIFNVQIGETIYYRHYIFLCPVSPKVDGLCRQSFFYGQQLCGNPTKSSVWCCQVSDPPCTGTRRQVHWSWKCDKSCDDCACTFVRINFWH